MTREQKRVLQRALSEYIEAAIQSAVPVLERPQFHPVRERLRNEVLKIFENYKEGGGFKYYEDRGGEVLAGYESKVAGRAFCKAIDPPFLEYERDLLVGFLAALPSPSGILTAKDRDLLTNLLLHSFAVAELDLSNREKKYLLDSYRHALKMFAGLSKIDETFAQEVFDKGIDRMLATLRGMLQRRKSEEEFNSLTRYIRQALDAADLELPDSVIERAVDQIVALFQDYANTAEPERERVYELAEERILISLFNPESRPSTMSRGR